MKKNIIQGAIRENWHELFIDFYNLFTTVYPPLIKALQIDRISDNPVQAG